MYDCRQSESLPIHSPSPEKGQILRLHFQGHSGAGSLPYPTSTLSPRSGGEISTFRVRPASRDKGNEKLGANNLLSLR